MKRLFFYLAAILTAAVANAQPQCNDDGTVTFNYRNDSAKSVMVDVQFAGRNEMKRDPSTGVWSVKLGPVAPDMYPYCFIVDGVSVMDPENPQYFPNEGFKNSLLEIPAREGTLPHDILDVPHGRMEYIHYYSQSLGATNTAIVYLPPGYMENYQKKYPVFYLISGTTDTEEVYYKVGRVNYILDNLLAKKAAKEMIVVLPYGNPSKLLVSPPTPSAWPWRWKREMPGSRTTGLPSIPAKPGPSPRISLSRRTGSASAGCRTGRTDPIPSSAGIPSDAFFFPCS